MALWKPKWRIEREYQRAVDQLLRYVVFMYGTARSMDEFQALVNQWTSTNMFSDYCEALASRMITGLFDDVGRFWRDAAYKNSKVRLMYDLLIDGMDTDRRGRLRQLIDVNSHLIRTLPESIAGMIFDYVSRETMAGKRPETMESEIATLFPKRTKARAKLIARVCQGADSACAV